jgi:hypothetical protein
LPIGYEPRPTHRRHPSVTETVARCVHVRGMRNLGYVERQNLVIEAMAARRLMSVFSVGSIGQLQHGQATGRRFLAISGLPPEGICAALALHVRSAQERK